jgi:hypothetical protein
MSDSRSDQTPKTQPASAGGPPRPPKKTARGLGGEFPDDSQQRVRLLGEKGKQLGIMTLSEATKLAEQERAKLVMIAPSISPPIYRLIAASERQKHIEKRRHI